MEYDKNSLTIKEIPYGIACRIGNIIYINKNIKGYSQELYEALIYHESNHSKGYTLQDFKNDLLIKELSGSKNLKGQYYWFILTHPKSLSELIPFWNYEGTWSFNPSLLMLYAIIFILVGGLGGWFG